MTNIRKNFEGADLQGTSFAWEDLANACLRNANLAHCDFTLSCLYRANFEGANLDSAKLYGAGTKDANFTNASFKNTNLNGADLVGSNVTMAQLGEAVYPYFARLPSRTLASNILGMIDNKEGKLDNEHWHSEDQCSHCLIGWAQILTTGGNELLTELDYERAALLLWPEALSYVYATTSDAMKFLVEQYRK